MSGSIRLFEAYLTEKGFSKFLKICRKNLTKNLQLQKINQNV